MHFVNPQGVHIIEGSELTTSNIRSRAIRNGSMLVCLLCSLMTSLHSQAQVFPRGNGMSLSGVEEFDVYVEIRNWVGLTPDPQEFRLNAQKIFETGIVSAGAVRRVASRDYLICRVQATIVSEWVAYTTRAEYWNITSVGVHSLLWENGSIASTARSQFNEALVANECAKYFTDEWQNWNRQ